MIELTPAFKKAIKSGPLKYLIQISEDDGVAWQDIPDGAQPMSPLGELSGETEITPFQFVGSDIEISCFNRDGFWTNSAGTGKLDTGYAVKARLKIAPQSIDNEWCQLIEGYIDLGSVTRYRTAFTVVFTVRGVLNTLDSVLANYVLADRSAKYPHKFGGWLEIVSVDGAHPDGLFELKFDASEQKISWDNGPGQSINTSSNIVLTGQSGNVITVRNMRSGTDATSLPQTSGTIIQWIAIKYIQSPTTGNYFKAALQPNTCMTLAQFKQAVYQYVDLNLDGVESIPIKRPDANIINYNVDFVNYYFTRMQPVHVVGIDANRWLISFDGGVITGNYILTVSDTDYFKVQSFARFDPSDLPGIIVNSYKSSTSLYLLCETATTRKHSYSNIITDWTITKYTLSLGFVCRATGTTTGIFYKSFVGFGDNDFCFAKPTGVGEPNYAVTMRVTMGTTVPITLSYTTVSGEYDTGVTMAPACYIHNSIYVCITGVTNATNKKTDVYLQIYRRNDGRTWSQLAEIEPVYDPTNKLKLQYGPISVVKNDGAILKADGTVETYIPSFYLLMGAIKYDATIGSITRQPFNSDKQDLYKISFTKAFPNSGYIPGIVYDKKTISSNFISGTSLLKTIELVRESIGLIVNKDTAFELNHDNEILYKNVPGGYPLAGDYNSDGTRILIATQDNLQVVDLNMAGGTDTTPNQYPEVALADFEDKTLREAVEQAAISANCFVMPSEHNKRLSLIYKGKAVNPVFTLLNTEYKEGPKATPYYDYDAVEVNGKRAGVFSAGNRQRDISLTTQTTPDAYSQSLAVDILKHIGSGDRTHEIIANGRVELEPGDEGYLELENGTQTEVMILGHNTNPESLDRSLIVREK